MQIRSTALAAAAAITSSCIPLEQVPPPRFTPRPPYPPEPVNPGQPAPTAASTTPHPGPATDTAVDQPEAQPPPLPRPTTAYPPARKTLNRNEVISPHPPHHRIDVSGFHSGQLARDPYTDKIFRIP